MTKNILAIVASMTFVMGSMQAMEKVTSDFAQNLINEIKGIAKLKYQEVNDPKTSYNLRVAACSNSLKKEDVWTDLSDSDSEKNKKKQSFQVLYNENSKKFMHEGSWSLQAIKKTVEWAFGAKDSTEEIKDSLVWPSSFVSKDVLKAKGYFEAKKKADNSLFYNLSHIGYQVAKYGSMIFAGSLIERILIPNSFKIVPKRLLSYSMFALLGGTLGYWLKAKPTDSIIAMKEDNEIIEKAELHKTKN